MLSWNQLSRSMSQNRLVHHRANLCLLLHEKSYMHTWETHAHIDKHPYEHIYTYIKSDTCKIDFKAYQAKVSPYHNRKMVD